MAALKAAFSAGVAICTLTPLPCRSFGASFAASCEASIAQAEAFSPATFSAALDLALSLS